MCSTCSSYRGFSESLRGGWGNLTFQRWHLVEQCVKGVSRQGWRRKKKRRREAETGRETHTQYEIKYKENKWQPKCMKSLRSYTWQTRGGENTNILVYYFKALICLHCGAWCVFASQWSEQYVLLNGSHSEIFFFKCLLFFMFFTELLKVPSCSQPVPDHT